MVRFRAKIRKDLRDNLPWMGGALAFFLAASSAYSHYKYFFWPTAEAVVDRIEPSCVYYKDGWRRSGYTEYVNCDAKQDAARLVADGYAYQGISDTMWLVYETEPGRKTYATLSSRPEGAGALGVGMHVRVRYNPGTPSRAEYAADPDRKGFVVALFVVVLTGSGYLLLKRH
ncbi:hypothetical protein [Taklimakanibacter albus]|uniref:Uncharacterized protein n=1 Tax=Taklimakanibacter albus TaxID=2800327 RepID=A0ACC5QXV7_9HYPH|nr:hypothetical protein [Aestuariivirga sp. YIM B02566]MBK1865224.1 hypothetical protein [Aestuariivirga sp. YIM B02566]